MDERANHELDAIRAVLTRQRSIAEVAATHAEAVRRQIQTLPLQAARPVRASGSPVRSQPLRSPPGQRPNQFV